MKLKLQEHSVAVMTLVICGIWLLYSAKIQDATMPGAPGPKFFPYIIVSLLAFLTILNEILVWRRLSHGAAVKKTYPGDGEKPPVKNSAEETADRKKSFFSFVLIFFYIAAIDIFGFYPAALTAVFLGLKGIMRISWLKSLSGAAIITGSVFVVFTLGFQLPLPRGIF
jgi:hypothetical protein